MNLTIAGPLWTEPLLGQTMIQVVVQNQFSGFRTKQQQL